MAFGLSRFFFLLELFPDGRFTDNSTCRVESGIQKTTAILTGPVTDIVCYGIGKIASCPIARYQFALLLLLKELLQVIHA